MWGTHWGKGTIGPQAAVPKRPHIRPSIFFISSINLLPQKLESFLLVHGYDGNHCAVVVLTVMAVVVGGLEIISKELPKFRMRGICDKTQKIHPIHFGRC